jgi:hypothetical protein
MINNISTAAILTIFLLFSFNFSRYGYAQITVSVTPSQADVSVNQSQSFIATVSGTPNQAVTWSVLASGPRRFGPGVINVSGQYTAPQLPTTPPFVIIEARSVADPTKVGTATVIVRGVRNYAQDNAEGDLSAINGGDYVQFTWTELPSGTTKIVLLRATESAGPWTQVAVNEDSRVLTPFRTLVYTDVDLVPPDTATDYFYKIEAFSSTGQLLKTYSPVFLPRSTY